MGAAYVSLFEGANQCADLVAQSAYLWNSSTQEFDVWYHAWYTYFVHFYYNYSTTNVYGYTQIQEPTGTYLPTIEAHAN